MANPPPNLPKVGMVHSGTQGNHDHQITAFKHSLELAGYVDGTNYSYVTERYADDVRANMRQRARDLLTQDNVKVLVAAGGSACTNEAMNARQAAGLANVPIVFTSFSDPTPPGANMTGVCARTSELDPKRLKLLTELSINGAVTQIGVLQNPTRDNFVTQSQKLQSVANGLGVHLTPGNATQQSEIAAAFQTFATNNVQAVLVTADPLFNNHHQDVLGHGPAIYQWREFAQPGGGLMSYGPSLTDAYKAAGDYVGRVLDLLASNPNPVALPPVVLLTSFELVINRTANPIPGLTIPQSLLNLADEVI